MLSYESPAYSRGGLIRAKSHAPLLAANNKPGSSLNQSGILELVVCNESLSTKNRVKHTAQP